MQCRKCIICGERPARTEKGYCAACNKRMDTAKVRARKQEPSHYLTYHGAVVGLYPTGRHTLRPELIHGANAEKLPKAKTVNLNEWCAGYTREMVKAFKACVLSLAEVRSKRKAVHA